MIKDQQGITLTELLVVAAIIMIMSAITIPNWNRGGDRLKVVRAAYQLNQDIRRAQELTLANADIQGCATTTGYGLHFQDGVNQSYILFAECGEFDGEYTFGDVAKEKIPLEEGVEIKNLIRKRVEGGSEVEVDDYLTVTFQPPDPAVMIKDEDAGGENFYEGMIELKSNEFCRRIKTNRVGLVDIDNCE